MIESYLRQGLAETNMSITDSAFKSFELVADELKKWNRKINLTAVTDDKGIAVKHIIDSLVFAELAESGDRVLDIGSGAGMPAIPLKICRPELEVVSVDAVGKKIQFQRHVSRLLGFRGFQAVHSRIENIDPIHLASYTLVTSRAFSSLVQFVLLALPFMAPTGRLVAMKGPNVHNEIKESLGLLDSHGIKVSSIKEYQLPFGLGERSLVTLTL